MSVLFLKSIRRHFKYIVAFVCLAGLFVGIVSAGYLSSRYFGNTIVRLSHLRPPHFASNTFNPPFIPVAYAATSSNAMSGWAWSDGVGWISFNCSNSGTGCNPTTQDYKVTVDTSNNLSGYAWSDTIGWIKFGGLSSFPSGPGTYSGNARISGSYLQGWARACSGTLGGDCSSMNDASAAFDGWISLSGTGYGPTLSGTTLSGYAWGSDAIGWITFAAGSNPVTIIPPNPTPPTILYFLANGTSSPISTFTNRGGSVLFTWDSLNADTCTSSGGSFTTSGATTNNSGVSSGAITNPVNSYTLSCSNVYGTSTSNFTIVIPACSDGLDNDNDGFIDNTPGLEDPGCYTGYATSSPANFIPTWNSENDTIYNNPLSGTFTAALVQGGIPSSYATTTLVVPTASTIRLAWSITGGKAPLSCSGTASYGIFTPGSASGSQNISSIATSTVYKLMCTDSSPAAQTISKTVRVINTRIVEF